MLCKCNDLQPQALLHQNACGGYIFSIKNLITSFIKADIGKIQYVERISDE